MGIDTIQNSSSFQTASNVQLNQISKTQQMKDMDKTNHQADNPFSQDEYISSEKSSQKPSGLYKLVPDENGRPKILYDDPKKSAVNSEKDKEAEMPKNIPSDNPDDNSEKCTTNTDKVDKEIKKLKEEKKQLEQQIKMASQDEEKVKELEKKLYHVESELSQKDNDTYRRQNAEVSGMEK